MTAPAVTTPEPVRNSYGPFYDLPKAREYDPDKHLGEGRAWTCEAVIEEGPVQQKLYGPPGTVMLVPRAWPGLGRVRSFRLYLNLHPGLGLAQATLGLIGDGGIEIEEPLGKDMVEWLLMDLLTTDEDSWGR